MALDWLFSYLSGRTQFAEVNDGISDVQRFVYGVPQGSVPGPMLYSLYTTPLGDTASSHGLTYPAFRLTILCYTYPLKRHLRRIWSPAKLKQKPVSRLLTHG